MFRRKFIYKYIGCYWEQWESARFVSFKLLFGYCLSSQKLKIHDTFVQKFQQLNINRFHSSNFGNAIADFRESKFFVEALDMVRIMYEVNIHSAACFLKRYSSQGGDVRMFPAWLELFFSPIKVGENSSNSTCRVFYPTWWLMKPPPI